MVTEKRGIPQDIPEDNGCPLHPRCAPDKNGMGGCPEPICAYEFPGGLKAYIRYKTMLALLEQGYDITSAADKLCMRKRTAERIFNKAKSLVRY